MATPCLNADDEADIRAMLADIDAKIIAHDVSGALAHFSSDYFQSGDDYAALSADLTENLPQVDSFHFQITAVTIDGDFATVSGTVDATLDGESSPWQEPADNDGLGLGWLKNEDGVWRVYGNQSRVGWYKVQTNHSLDSGNDALRIAVENPFEIESATVTGPYISPTTLSPDSYYGGVSGLTTPTQRPLPGTEYQIEISYANGAHETVTDTIGAWIDTAPELTISASNGSTNFYWTDVAADVANASKYMLSVQGNGIEWRFDNIPLSQTSTVFNADGSATGALQPGLDYSASITVVNDTFDHAYRIYQFTAVNDGGQPSQAVIDFISWLQQHFNSQQLQDLAIVDKNADPDGDGLTNYFEFLANLDPADLNSRISFSFIGDTLRISPFDIGANGEVRFSNNLQDWNPIEQGDYQIDGQELQIDLNAFSVPGFFQLVLLEN